MPRAVLFDLDDTLFDHSASAQAGLRAWLEAHPALRAGGLEELERVNRETLEAVHLRLLAGELTVARARELRTLHIFAHYGLELEPVEARYTYRAYREAYEASRGLVPGVRAVLEALRARPGLRLGVVTNNLVEEQERKLADLGLAAFFDDVVISEGVGLTKPDPRIFALAAERLGVEVGETVMVGDSLANDVEGALAAGMSAVWLDRAGASGGSAPCAVLPGWLPREAAMGTLLAG